MRPYHARVTPAALASGSATAGVQSRMAAAPVAVRSDDINPVTHAQWSPSPPISYWLKMNSDKTDCIWLGSKQQLVKTQCQSICLNAVRVPVSTEVTCRHDMSQVFVIDSVCMYSRCTVRIRLLL